VLSWADCDTDEDDISVGTSTAGNETDAAVCVKESFEEFNGHNEDMVFDELDEDDEDDLAVTVPIEPPCRSSKSTVIQERQLSKKEMKKLELEKLEAIFAEFGVEVGVCAEAEKETDLGESKAAARRRKKAARVVSTSEQLSEKKTANSDDAPGKSDTVLIDPVAAKKLVAAKLTGKKKNHGLISSTAVAEAKARAGKLKRKGKTKNKQHQQVLLP
jgi:hypothetical protein